MPNSPTQSLFVRVTFPLVETGTRRRFRVERNSVLAHDYDVGSEQLEALVPAALNDTMQLYLYPYPHSHSPGQTGQMNDRPLNTMLAVKEGTTQAMSPTQIGYSVEAGDVEQMRPKMRAIPTKLLAPPIPEPPVSGAAAPSSVAGTPTPRPPAAGEVYMSGLPQPVSLGPSQPAPPPTKPPAPPPHKNKPPV